MTSVATFICPTCKNGLIAAQKKQYSFLLCQFCHSFTPVIEGFALFNESKPYSKSLIETSAKLTKKFSDKVSYQQYLDNKFQRDVMEVYAAFQPFNESSRAIYPFIDYLQLTLKKGGLIIDTWSRTGWSALLLANLFPDQHIISIWEGDNSVLGYAGYGYWFSDKNRPKNLTVIFLAPEQDLPFKESSACLIHGHDIAHRREMRQYIPDILRVVSDDGIVMLPHIHLSNNEPDPYFERGGIIRHGLEYKNYCEELLRSKPLNAMILSETEIFEAKRPVLLNDAANSSEYNGMLIIGPDELFKLPLTEHWLMHSPEEMLIISNPLLTIDFFTMQVTINSIGTQNKIDYLLDRHPVYKKRLCNKLPKIITPLQRDILLHSKSHLTLTKISELLKVKIANIIKATVDMTSDEVITLLPVSSTLLKLQHFHSNNHNIIQQSFTLSLNKLLTEQASTKFMMLEGELIDVEQLYFLISAWRRYLQLKNDISSILLGKANPLSIPFVMACWLENIEVNTDNITKYNGIKLITSQTEGNTRCISFLEEERHSFWNILEPFLSDEIIPILANSIVLKELVDKKPWNLWLNQMMKMK